MESNVYVNLISVRKLDVPEVNLCMRERVRLFLGMLELEKAATLTERVKDVQKA